MAGVISLSLLAWQRPWCGGGICRYHMAHDDERPEGGQS